MNKYFLLFLCLIAVCSLVQSQETLINQQQDSINFHDKTFKTIYRIKLCNSPLVVELIEKLDGEFFGNLNIEIDRNFEGKEENFVGKMPIESLMVKKLITKFRKIALESVKNCTENGDCTDGLDGVDTEFIIKSNEVIREYRFWELIPNQKNKNTTPENRKRAQKILNVLDKELNLKLKNHELRHKLPKGRYSRWVGAGIEQYDIK
jgi:hypothetical protein